jgi:HEAT repeat protein
MTLESLTTLLKSRRTEDRIRAVQRLAALPGVESQRWLLRALRDRSNYVATLAAEALSEVAEEDIALEVLERFEELLTEGAKGDPGCHIRSHLALALARLDYQPSIPALRRGIRTVQIEAVGGTPFDTGAHLRANCALALAQLRAPDAARDIAGVLFDIGRNRVDAGLTSPEINV